MPAYQLLHSSYFHDACRTFGRYDAETVEEWSSILDLSIRFELSPLHDVAFEQLSRIATPVDKIVLARHFHISEWLVPAYVQVCLRKEPPSKEEGRRLGVDEVIDIVHVRHAIRQPSQYGYLPRSGSQVEEEIRKVLNITIPPSKCPPQYCSGSVTSIVSRGVSPCASRCDTMYSVA